MDGESIVIVARDLAPDTIFWSSALSTSCQGICTTRAEVLLDVVAADRLIINVWRHSCLDPS